MIHIVFQTADVEVLRNAIALDETLAGDVIEIKDDFAVGPIDALDTEEGWELRLEWWRQLVGGSPYAKDITVGSFDDRKTVADLKVRLDEEEKETVWIWMGQNAHDVCGYYWLVSQLKEYSGRVVVLYFNNLPFINEKGQLFYPTCLHQVLPREFLKAKKLNRLVSSGEFEVDPDEWKKLCTENAMVRTLEGGKKLLSRDADYFDKDVLGALSSEAQKGSKAVNTILSKMKVKTGDVFIIWRLKELAAAEKVVINGEPAKGWKDFEVRLNTPTPQAVTTNPES